MVDQRGSWPAAGGPPQAAQPSPGLQPSPGWQPSSGWQPYPGLQPPAGLQLPWRPPPLGRPPSGLFPGGPVRPTYREPHPIGAGGLLAGLGGGLLWMGLFGMIGQDLAGYAWWTLFAAVAAWTSSMVLAYLGDRGVAVGVAISAGLGWAIVAGVVASRWLNANPWTMG